MLALGELSLPVASSSTGQKFPGQTLRAAVVRRPGCVTSDHPSRLILMDVLSRNLERGCPLVVDLGGANYDAPDPGRDLESRRKNPVFQHYAGESTEPPAVPAHQATGVADGFLSRRLRRKF